MVMMMINSSKYMINFLVLCFSLAILLLSSIESLAKPTYPIEDGQDWGSMQFKIRLIDDLDLELGQELRYNQYGSNFNQSISEFGLAYKYQKLKFSIFYRYRYNSDEQDEQDEFNFSVNYKPFSKKIILAYRSRFQFRFRDNEENINNFRNKLTFGYKISDYLQPYLASELYYRFMSEDGDRISQARFEVGNNFELTRNIDLELYFMREQEYNRNKPIHSNILGFNLSIRLL